MYKIVNNNIYITRGETATYHVKVIDGATGAPFILPALSKAIVSFGVRRSDYIKDGFAIKKQLWLCGIDENVESKPDVLDCTDQIKLDTEIVYTYDPNELAPWDDDYNFINTEISETQPNDIKALFRRLLPDGTYEYKANLPEKQSDGSYKPHWVDYEFVIRFPFLYGDTSQLSPKSYKYSMTIYGGNNLQVLDGDVDPNTIDYKKPLIDAQSIVEADINE